MASSGFSIRFDLNEQAFRQMHEQGGLFERAASRAAGKVRDEARRELTLQGRVDSGRLRQSINVQRVSTTSGVHFRVGSPLHYAIYQHEGVKGPVTPRRARVLRFVPKGGSSYVFARSTSGFSGAKYLTKALNRVNASDFSVQ